MEDKKKTVFGKMFMLNYRFIESAFSVPEFYVFKHNESEKLALVNKQSLNVIMTEYEYVQIIHKFMAIYEDYNRKNGIIIHNFNGENIINNIEGITVVSADKKVIAMLSDKYTKLISICSNKTLVIRCALTDIDGSSLSTKLVLKQTTKGYELYSPKYESVCITVDEKLNVVETSIYYDIIG